MAHGRAHAEGRSWLSGLACCALGKQGCTLHRFLHRTEFGERKKNIQKVDRTFAVLVALSFNHLL